ncbi:MAG: sugar ABC transporter ATP-binding protein [Hespellia sp.]|nr:sugar ABC transporter ATP-binding protein [Hespellia sp.]
MTDERLILEIHDIYKSFYQNEVLHGVDFSLKAGEIHGLVGGNGAGKSTLMKIINGVYRKDSGVIKVDGEEVFFHTALDARKAGIAMVYQEFSLIPSMTVMDNLFLANEKKKKGLLDRKEMYLRTKEVLARLHLDVDPNLSVEELSVGNKQILEIAKALMHQNTKVLILDEPTASLTGHEIEILFQLMREVKAQKIGVILVSHHLQEIMDICDVVTILRGGVDVLSQKTDETNLENMVSAMVGHKVEKQEYLAPSVARTREPILQVKNLYWKNMIQDVSFSVYGGEVVGIAGMMGSGRTEILNMLYGLAKPSAGQILLNGKEIHLNHPHQAITQGIGMVPEDRRTCGIIAEQSVRMNILLPIWKRISKRGMIQEKKGRKIAQEAVENLSIKTSGMEQSLSDLSGGNQQKVVFAKSIVSEPKIYLLDDPTVGVDVEFKSSICREIRKIADHRNAILLVTGELDEMAKIADRILILKHGSIIGEIVREAGQEITEEKLLLACQSGEIV